MSLDGSIRGIAHMFTPDIRKQWSIKIWSEAINQAFFQYSIGMGVCVVFASFRPTKKPVYGGVTFIAGMNAFSSTAAVS